MTPLALPAFPLALALFTVSAVCWRVARDVRNSARQTMLILYLAFMFAGIVAMLALLM
ncbi:MAG: hypothetical protein QXH27_01350 [Candidatus Micrarchaeia archaeon]